MIALLRAGTRPELCLRDVSRMRETRNGENGTRSGRSPDVRPRVESHGPLAGGTDGPDYLRVMRVIATGGVSACAFTGDC